MTKEQLLNIGERHSFAELFKSYDYSIEIPIIQRDYAQGRTSKLELRENFLLALRDYLEENVPFRDLDFVYGYINSDVDGDAFIPLDGQQRLTTLFLLHWYLAHLSGNVAHLRNLLLRDGKSRFTYRTRTSSSEFCDALLMSDIDLEATRPVKNGKSWPLSNLLTNQHWFFNNWSLDPTVQSMLTVLDSMEVIFKVKKGYYARLVDPKAPIITFLFLDLNNLQQSDDLYIKMNSRGKPLSPFENFKAKFEQEIAERFAKSPSPYFLKIEGRDVAVSVKDYFSFNIDAIWSNLFWQYRALSGNDHTYDAILLNFIRTILVAHLLSDRNIKIEEIEPLLAKDISSVSRFKQLGLITNDAVLALTNILDSIYNGNDKLKHRLDDQFYYNEESIFILALQNNLGSQERIKFYAYLSYLTKFPDQPDGLADWMRVVHNLVEHTRFDTPENLVSGMRSIAKLLSEGTRIIDFLAMDQVRIDFFYNPQVTEERIKAILIKKGIDWKGAILGAEKNNFNSGQIAYLLEFSKIWHFYLANGDLSWSETENESYLNSLRYYTTKGKHTFSVLDGDTNKDYLLERAVLSKGFYLIPASNHRYNFCSATTMANYLRDYSWKRLLRINPEEDITDLENIWAKKRGYIRELLEDEQILGDRIELELKQIIKRPAEGFRAMFIKEPRLIRYCRQGFIYAEKFAHINLLNASQMNHLRIDMMTYLLFLELKAKPESLLPFKSIDDQPVKGHYEQPYLSLHDWCYKKIWYEAYLYYYFDWHTDQGQYFMEFKKPKGSQQVSAYAPEVTVVLTKHGINWNDQLSYFNIASPTKAGIIKKLQMLLVGLNELT